MTLGVVKSTNSNTNNKGDYGQMGTTTNTNTEGSGI